MSLLKTEVGKWKHHASQFDEGMISLIDHKNISQELREQWAKEIFFQKIRWEKMQEKLKELRKYESMEKEKEQMLTLTHELLRCRAPPHPILYFSFKI